MDSAGSRAGSSSPTTFDSTHLKRNYLAWDRDKHVQSQLYRKRIGYRLTFSLTLPKKVNKKQPWRLISFAHIRRFKYMLKYNFFWIIPFSNELVKLGY